MLQDRPEGVNTTAPGGMSRNRLSNNTVFQPPSQFRLSCALVVLVIPASVTSQNGPSQIPFSR